MNFGRQTVSLPGCHRPTTYVAVSQRSMENLTRPARLGPTLEELARPAVTRDSLSHVPLSMRPPVLPRHKADGYLQPQKDQGMCSGPIFHRAKQNIRQRGPQVHFPVSPGSWICGWNSCYYSSRWCGWVNRQLDAFLDESCTAVSISDVR
ncbi:hypothetical protein N658DRAFT_320402 [Parathielavia hyrcaniae]|uniref:Uncharacterized protein n=1 Tax=Parathielavia hyrcaniae TaxID=113614 RepID=A0AAN6Q336_9PEZI|nr:hypothetical protein N658DRAFT_320402 [Parathielavia hyrcaniae]